MTESEEDKTLAHYLRPYLKNVREVEKEEFAKRTQRKRAKEHKNELSKTYFIPKTPEIRAYLITFADEPGLLYVAFEKNKDRAKWVATKYFYENGHPTFMNKQRDKKFFMSRTHMMPEFDKYSITGRVPILELLKAGFSFPCYACQKGNFTLSEYEDHQCIIIEDGTDMNVFTRGIILCSNCYHQLTLNNSA